MSYPVGTLGHEGLSLGDAPVGPDSRHTSAPGNFFSSACVSGQLLAEVGRRRNQPHRALARASVAGVSVLGLPLEMSAYERQRWIELMAHWERKGRTRSIVPGRMREAWIDGRQSVGEAGARAGRAMGDRLPQKATDLATTAAIASLGPLLTAAAHTLELVNDWVLELCDPEPVLRYHRDQGYNVKALADLHALDLQVLDAYTRLMALRWRTIGGVEGAGLGALAMIPVPGVGSAAAIGLDLLAMQVLTGALATRVCYAYGIDVQDLQMRPVVERMVARSYRDQAGKAAVMSQAGAAMTASAGRVNWSDQLRKNHQLMAALEKLMQNATRSARVPVQTVRMGLPFVSVVAGAGTNQYVLGDTANQARQYAATLHLASKYGLAMPSTLTGDEGVTLGGSA